MRLGIIFLFLLSMNLYAQFGGEFHNEYKSGFDEEFMAGFEDEFNNQKNFDPLEGYNRFMTNVNDKIYVYGLNPLAKGYKKVTPEPIRQNVKNFFYNLMYPIRVSNNLLQGKFKNAVEETGSFFLNSTLGLCGLFDVAAEEEILRHEEDFGQTLGFYGVPSGFHIVLPLLGPSNLRDFPASFVDGTMSPLNATNALNYELPRNSTQSLYLHGFRTINEYSYKVQSYESMKKNTIDTYIFMKDMYENRREKLINE